MSKNPAFHGTLLVDLPRKVVLEFTCLRCHRKKLVPPFRLPKAIQDRAEEVRVRELEAKAYCDRCRRRKLEPMGGEVVPGHSAEPLISYTILTTTGDKTVAPFHDGVSSFSVQ